MSIRETMGLPPEFSLHRYWIYANRMMEHFDAALRRGPPKLAAEVLKDASRSPLEKAILTAVAMMSDDYGIFMSYWYGSLYVVIEGWRQLDLRDPGIDSLLSSPNVALLKSSVTERFTSEKLFRRQDV